MGDRSALFGIVLCIGIALGCGPSGKYVWVHELPDSAFTPAPSEYRLAVGDAFSVRVFGQETAGARVKIAPDGNVQLPLLGEVRVIDRTPGSLARDLEVRYKKYFVNPSVVVVLEEFAPASITVLGEVGHTGAITLTQRRGVLDALAAAGGLNDFAHRDRIFILRGDPRVGLNRIRFSFERLTQGEPRSSTFLLRTGDIVVVE